MSVGNFAVLYVHHKNERHLHLSSQNVCLVNAHFLIYWHSRCDYKLWNDVWFYYVFRVFSYIYDNHSCLNCSVIANLINSDVFQMWLQVMECLLILLLFFELCTKLTNIHIWCTLSSTFINYVFDVNINILL